MATQVAPDTRPEAQGAQPSTIPRLWQDAVAEGRSRPAYLVERAEGWEPVSWAEAATAVEELANGLLALGVKKGDAFGILGQTSLEWAHFDFALAHVGAVGAAIYANSAAKDCEYILDHSESVGVLVQDAEQLAKLEDYRARNPRLEHVLTFDDLDDLRARGRDYALAYPGELERVVAAVSPDDVFTYIYTSGTTGPPKACMILHRNYYAMAAVVDEIDDFTMADDTMLLYLPLAHNFGRLMHLQGPYVGFTLAFLADPLRAGEALKAVQPTLFPSVPRVFEKVHTAVLAKFDDETGAKRKIVDWALGVGRKASERRSAGKALGPVLGAQHRLADKLVYSKVKAQLGGNFRIGISGGAPLSKEIAEFFHSLDVLILEGYGLTECTTAATVNRPSRFRFGTVGPALPGTELRIAEDGEVLISSPTVFAGYYKDEEATREVLGPDGWLRSGDIGDLDDDGFLTITDRKKDIIVTAGGKNVAPQNLENELKAVEVRLAGARRRGQAPVLHRADHARRAGARQVGAGARREGRALARCAGRQRRRPRARRRDRRAHERRPLPLRADQEVHDPPARLHDGRRRAHGNAEAQAPRLPGALRGRDRRALR